MISTVKKYLVYWVFTALFVTGLHHGEAQTLPEVLEEGTLQEQYDYLQQRTNIYNNFRAIREDMFQQIKNNSLDSLRQAFSEIEDLNVQIRRHQNQIDSLETLLTNTYDERDEAIRERDSLFLFGLPINKTFYNLLLWSIIGILAILFAIAFIMYRRCQMVTNQKNKELKEVQIEFEEYRKSSRERFEKQAIDHFNEVKRLRGI
ncbi:MAG: hypothetical protein ACOCX0_04955 [Bacteroidota bacterium]